MCVFVKHPTWTSIWWGRRSKELESSSVWSHEMQDLVASVGSISVDLYSSSWIQTGSRALSPWFRGADMEDIYKVGEKWLKTAVDTTSTIASTTTAIVATSSARALGIIGSTSGRPEVYCPSMSVWVLWNLHCFENIFFFTNPLPWCQPSLRTLSVQYICQPKYSFF